MFTTSQSGFQSSEYDLFYLVLAPGLSEPLHQAQHLQATMDQAVRPTYKPGLLDRLTVAIFHFVNRFIAWHKLPSLIGALNLEALRVELRQYNLHDTYPDGSAQGTQATCPMTNKRFEKARDSEGMFNSTEMPKMGCAGMRFGRNFPRAFCPKPYEEDLWNPNPRMVSSIAWWFVAVLRPHYCMTADCPSTC
jgi:hypothetical protein